MHDGWRTKGTAHLVGDDVEHDGPILPLPLVSGRVTDPDKLIPHLFENYDPALLPKLKAGDFIVAGRNFGCGKPHTGGYIAMQSLGVRVLCESMPGAIVRATLGLALPCMWQCAGITKMVSSGDVVEADFVTGQVVNHTTGEARVFPSVPEEARNMIKQGGVRGLLKHWLEQHPELASPL